MKRKVIIVFFIMLATILLSIILGRIIDDAYISGSFTIWKKITDLPIIAKKIGIGYWNPIYFLSEDGEYYIWDIDECISSCLEKSDKETVNYYIERTKREYCYKEANRIGKLPGIIKDCIYPEPIGEMVGTEIYILLDDNSIWSISFGYWDPGGLVTMIREIIIILVIELLLLVIVGITLLVVKIIRPTRASS